MATGRWVNIPGKGRRWQQPSGELMMTKPGFGQGEFFQTRSAELLRGLNNSVNPRYSPEQMRTASAATLVPGAMASTQPQVPVRNQREVGTQAVLNGNPVYWGGNDYGWQQLNQGGTSATLNSLNKGSTDTGGQPGSNAAAERAYQTEKDRIAQQVAQDPALSQYERTRAAAVASGDQAKMNAARDEGMRIWAQKNPELAKKVKPGQVGYEAIQGMMAPSAASALSNEQILGVMSFDPNTVLSTTQNIQTQFRPNQPLTDQEILAAMSFDPNVAMRSAANIGYAPMSSTEAQMLKEVGGDQGEYITPMNSFVTPAEQRRQNKSDAFSQLLQGISQYGGM